MLKFLIDTTNSYLLLAAVKDGNVLFTFINKFINRANETLLNAIDDCLRNNRLSLKCVDEFYVIIGPGSYTGIRIGVATILAFSIVYSKPLIGISLLDAYVLSLDKDIVKAFYCLRDNIYVTKQYSFCDNNYTDYEIIESPILNFEGSLIIGDNLYNPANTLLNEKLPFFKRDYKPMYFGNNFYDKIKN
jgi:tRNA threonylcarbamoyladenosine biosynthesis protein TsaB